MNNTLKPWLGGILSKFVSGMFHGTVLGTGSSTAMNALLEKFSGTASSPQHGLLILILGGVSGALIGGIKDVAFFISSNPMPNVFDAPTIAPTAGPVAKPTVSDQPQTLSAAPDATTAPAPAA